MSNFCHFLSRPSLHYIALKWEAFFHMCCTFYCLLRSIAILRFTNLKFYWCIYSSFQSQINVGMAILFLKHILLQTSSEDVKFLPLLACASVSLPSSNKHCTASAMEIEHIFITQVHKYNPNTTQVCCTRWFSSRDSTAIFYLFIHLFNCRINNYSSYIILLT